MEKYGTITAYNADCTEILKQYPAKYFDLAIVDPPYGLGMDGTIGFANKKTKGFTFEKKVYKKRHWDNETPPASYFEELFRVSKNQIIWGANYMTDKIPPIKNFIYWHKKGKSVDTKHNEGELAYTSAGITRMFDHWWNGFGVINSGEKKRHPTQKPVALYKWLLTMYAKPGFKILDTHGGSMTHAMAAHDLGYDLTIIEKDAEIYADSIKHLVLHQKQQTIKFN